MQKRAKWTAIAAALLMLAGACSSGGGSTAKPAAKAETTPQHHDHDESRPSRRTAASAPPTYGTRRRAPHLSSPTARATKSDARSPTNSAARSSTTSRPPTSTPFRATQRPGRGDRSVRRPVRDDHPRPRPLHVAENESRPQLRRDPRRHPTRDDGAVAARQDVEGRPLPHCRRILGLSVRGTARSVPRCHRAPRRIPSCPWIPSFRGLRPRSVR